MNLKYRQRLLVSVVAASLTIGTASAQVYKSGPSGGMGGREFVDDVIPPQSKVVEVRIRATQLLDAVQIVHQTGDGARHEFPAHGGGGGEVRVFLLDEGEYITGISGRCGEFVDSIRIHTNKQTSALYGGTGGPTEYHYEAPQGTEVVGFYGRAAQYVDAIGVVLRKRQ
jgi:hypothetical protein